jgi:hypothetical protein
VINPRPNKAVVSRRSRALSCDDRLTCVSMLSALLRRQARSATRVP